MSLLSHLESLFQNFPRNTDLNDELSTKNITDLQSLLYKFINTKSGLSLSEADDNFHSQLCIFKNQLGSNQHRNINPEVKALCLQIADQLNIAISSDIKYNEAKHIYDLLCDLSLLIQRENFARTRKKKFLRRVLLAAAMIPLTGMSLHYLNGTLQPMILDEVHIVYPPLSYEYRDDTYKIKESLVDESLNKFSRLFFKDDIINPFTEENDIGFIQAFKEGDESDLVHKQEEYSENILNRIFASGYDLENDPLELKAQNSPLIARIIDDVEPKDSFHLTKLRVFLKNIKNNHVVNNLEVRISKIKGSSFPWGKIRTEAALEFGSYRYNDDVNINAPEIYAYALNAPISYLKVEISAYTGNEKVGISYSEEFKEGIIEREQITPDFGLKLGAIDKPKFTALYVSPEKLSQYNFEPRYSISSLKPNEGDFVQFLRQNFTNGNLGSLPYFYQQCPDGGSMVIGSNENLAELLSLQKINEFKIDYIYKSINGKTVTNTKNFSPDKNVYILEEGIVYDYERLNSCDLKGPILKQINHMGIEKITVEGQRMSLRNISDFDALAIHLMDTDKVPVSSIEKEVTLIFAEIGNERVLSQSIEIPSIFHDGNYLMTNLWIVNFQEGDYNLSFYVDSQKVGEANINILWPTFHDYYDYSNYYQSEYFPHK